MSNHTAKSIRLTINRQEQTILISDIVYAQVTDKLCSIHLVEREPYRLFITIASLKAMLPSDSFLQISRSCLVSLDHLQNIDSEYVFLRDGTMLPYSLRQKTTILHAFQQHLSKQAQKQARSSWKMNIFEEFRCYDRCPFPLSIVEVTNNPYTHQPEYYYRYGNEALAAMIHMPVHELVNRPFFIATPTASPVWRDIFSQCAFAGGSVDKRMNSSIDGRPIRVVSYQPHFGFCASLILDDAPVLQSDCQ